MATLKFPILSTFVLYALTGLLAFYMPLPEPEVDSSLVSKIIRNIQ